jgi:hypothetical protein
MIGEFLEDLWMICAIADNLYNYVLFVPLWIIHTMADYLRNFTDILWDQRYMCEHVCALTFVQNQGFT